MRRADEMEVIADEQSPNGDMRLATTIAGQPVYPGGTSRERKALKAAGYEYARWVCRSDDGGPNRVVYGWA